METNQRIQELLQKYELASGQKINTNKTKIVFSRNVSRPCRNDICSMWSRGHNKQYEKYLGLSPIISRSKMGAFKDIKAKL